MDDALLEIKRQNEHNYQFSLLEQEIGCINRALARIDQSVHLLGKKLDKHFESTDKKIEKINSRTWANFYWVMGTMFSLAGAFYMLVAKGFGWTP